MRLRGHEGVNGHGPHTESAAIMAVVDGLPKAWRELVYEHGFRRVIVLYSEGFGLADAREMLGGR